MRIQNILLAERGQWALWLPVAFASGIAAYFALPIEPPLRWGLGAAGALLVLSLLNRNDAVRALMLGLMAASLGFTAATLRTETVRAPVLTHKLGPLTLEGTVRHATPAPGAVKLVLIDIAAPDLLPEATPARIRITVRVASAAPTLPKPGERVSMLTILRPPPPPVMPGAFDFQRHAYFLKIGAYGFRCGRRNGSGMRRPKPLRKRLRAALKRCVYPLRRACLSATEDRQAQLQPHC